MMWRWIACVLCVVLASSASAQQVPLQGGPWTVGHVPSYNSPAQTQPIIQDGGGAGGGGLGTNPSEIGITEVSPTNTYPAVNAGNGPNYSPFCIYDGPTTGQYHYLCFGPNSNGSGLLTYGAGGGAAQLPLYFNVNGVQQTIGGTSSLTIGTTAIFGSPATGVLYNSAGVLGALATLPYTLGGTGLSSLGSPNQCLTTNSGGTGMAWAACAGSAVTSVAQTFTGGIVSVSGSPITSSGTLALTVTGTSGGVPYFSSATTWASSPLLTANNLMIGGGAGSPPATTTTGSNVLTALANAVNAANGLPSISGSLVPGDCLKWGPGVQDAGGACTVSGGGISFPQTVAGTVTSGGIPYFNSTTSMSSSALLASGAVMLGAGAGSAPTTTTTGSGVVTAIGNTVNTASGLTTQNGAITTNDCLKWGPGITDAGAACGSGSGGTLTIGTSVVSGATNGYFLYNNSGVLGAQTAVTSIGTSCGATGGTINTTGTIAGTVSVDAQTGSSYAIPAIDCGGLVSLSNASAQAPTLTNSAWTAGNFLTVVNTGAGTQTITPSSGTICGLSALPLTQGQGVGLAYAGSNVWNCDGGPYVVSSLLGTGVNASLQLPLNGSGALSATTSPTFVTPALGTIASGNLASGTGYLATNLAAIGGNTVLGNGTGSSAAPQALAMPSCSANGQYLQWTSASGFACINGVPSQSISGTGNTFTGYTGFAYCSAACTITPPVPPASGVTAQFCVFDKPTTTGVITIANPGSSVQFSNQTRSAYGTATTGTLTSGGAAGDAICITSIDATHYIIASANGTITAN